jgi:hypothetical protein
MLNLRSFVLAIVAITLTACASTDIARLGGPAAVGTAVIEDSVANVSGSAGDYFVLYSINGHDIKNALVEPNEDHASGTQIMQPALIARRVPARPAIFTIVASALYVSSDRAVAHPLYQVAGDLEFTPQSGATYIVRGHLDPKRSLIWLEDARSGAVVAGTFVTDGSTAAALLHR